MTVTDPAWGIRVMGVCGAVVIGILLSTDQLPAPPDRAHVISMLACLVGAGLFALLPSVAPPRLVAALMPVGPFVGTTNLALAMRVVDSASTALALALLCVWVVIFYGLYGERWHSGLAVGLSAAGLCTGLWNQLGGLRASVFAATALVVLTVSAVIMTAVSERVRAASTTDSLTGAVSRRGLVERAPGFALRHRGRHRGVAVVVLDLDGFKAYNDLHGHAAGDALLVEAVRAWGRLLPAGSLLARTGGDEFVALVATSALGAAADADLLDDLRRAAPDGVRASAGSAPWPVGTTLESAVHEADSAMYLDKGDRRRGAVTAPPAAAVDGPERVAHTSTA